MTRPATFAAATAVLVLAVGGCSSGTPAAMRSAGDAAAGTQRVTCDVRTAHGPATVAVDLPTGFRERRSGRAGCVWTMRVTVRDGSGPYDAVVVVTLSSARLATLRDVYDDQEPNAVDGDSPLGDDSILHLALDEDVASFGETVGDRLAWNCYCDGQDLITRMAQADAVRLTWDSVRQLEEQTDTQLDAALANAGTVG